jgi:hypothetical protein
VRRASGLDGHKSARPLNQNKEAEIGTHKVVWKKFGAHVDKLNSTILATEDCVVRNKYVELYSTHV